MADVEIIVDRTLVDRLKKVYGDFADYTQQLTKDLVKEEGALTCREAINYSPPLDGKAGGKGDKKIAERWGNYAVENDIKAVVSDDSKSLATAVSSGSNARQKFNKWRSGKSPAVSGIIKKIWEDQNAERAFKKAQNLFGRWAGQRLNLIQNETELKLRHERIRANYKGRIRKNGAVSPLGGIKGETPAYADRKLIESYIKKRQLKVGYMKAGWVDAINKIGKPKVNGVEKTFGLRKLPTWITRHKVGHGGVGLNVYEGAGTNNVIMKVRNDLANIFGVGYLAGTKTYVMAVRAGKMTKRMNHFMRAAIKKANNNQSPT
jgi:hypothetical protein